MVDESRELEFSAFYNQFLPQVYRYVRYRVVDAATAEDLDFDPFAWPPVR
jgi:DNA-directed RNA polymerase specialized sigma24 family protein